MAKKPMLDEEDHKLILEHYRDYTPDKFAAHFSEKTGTTVTDEDVIQAANNLRKRLAAEIKDRFKDGDPEEMARLLQLLAQVLPRKRRKSGNAMDSAVEEFFAKADPPTVPNADADADATATSADA
ncbi:MAG: hypothetical protein KFB96_07435 [Thiocapsa sp.]|uniref:hypothetical protein n=1 Tax=Thiocapsa sp. TaxID=2024551 RepID=UPI001BD121AE|nr:hypothetical protein [Thiocapsa sp.]QVL50261.1 MAG: hypothetical protein KFB96_07435 [Thiocapsa sp.]